MGLDMYLEARKYVSRHDLTKPYDQDKGFTESDEFASVIEHLPLGLELYGESGLSIGVNVAYWRKAYAIFDWIIIRTEYESGEVWIPRETLIELRSDVEKVLADHSYASELLPDTSAFEKDRYDDWYYKQLEYTQKTLAHLLDRESYEDLSFYFSASW